MIHIKPQCGFCSPVLSISWISDSCLVLQLASALKPCCVHFKANRICTARVMSWQRVLTAKSVTKRTRKTGSLRTHVLAAVAAVYHAAPWGLDWQLFFFYVFHFENKTTFLKVKILFQEQNQNIYRQDISNKVSISIHGCCTLYNMPCAI